MRCSTAGTHALRARFQKQNPVPKRAKDCRPRAPARLFLSGVSPHGRGFGPRREAEFFGVRRVIILSIETHPDMMSLCTGLGTHGHAWVRWAAALRSARRLPHAPTRGARAPGSHVTPDASHLTARPPAHAHGSTAQSTESQRRQDTSHKDAHYKSPQGSAQMPPPRACKSRSCTNAQSMHLPAISTEYVSSPAPVSHGIA